MKEFVSDQRIADYVCKRTGIVLGGSDFTALGVIEDGRIIAGLVFNHFTGNDIHMTAAGEPRGFSPIFLRRVGDYVFGELGCLRVSFTTERRGVIKRAMRLGARVEGFKRDHFGIGRAGTMLGLLKDDWILAKPHRANVRRLKDL
jgi:hypothetical protein